MEYRDLLPPSSNSKQTTTDWDGVMHDLFGLDPLQTVESTHDSSSGIASDVATYCPTTRLSTFKGDSTPSDKLSLQSQDSGTKNISWAKRPQSKTSNHYVQMHMRSQQAQHFPHGYKPPTPHKPHKTRHDYHHIEAQVEIINSKVQYMDLQDTEKLLQCCSKGKHLAIRPSPFDLLTDSVVLRILSHLPTDHLCRCSRVCRRWYHLVWEPSLWTSIVINNNAINIDRVLKYLMRRLSYNTPTVCVILECISLNGCEQLTDKGLHTVAKRCPELRHLEVQGCSNITNVAIFEIVSYCVNMEHLDVTGCPLVTCISLIDDVFSHATSHHLQQIYLRYLDMTDCYALDDRGLSIIACHCNQLQFLYLRRCVQLTDEGVAAVANNCCSLREFSVSDCKRITDLGLRELSRLGENLRYLSVAKCEKVSDVGVRYIAKYCPKLRYLNVRGCEAVSDDSIELLACSCPRLKSLDVGKCDITDEGLQVLAENCPQLRKLSLKSCDAVTDKGIILVAYHCRGLQQFNVQDCHLSVEAYKLVKKYCRRCFIEHTNPAIY